MKYANTKRTMSLLFSFMLMFIVAACSSTRNGDNRISEYDNITVRLGSEIDIKQEWYRHNSIILGDNVTITSDDPEIVFISSEGIMNAKKEGSTSIEVNSDRGTDIIDITVVNLR